MRHTIMPTYEYQCPKGHRFEVFQRMSDAPAASCPECGGAAERKISGGAGFLFKGEGFYITDYRSEDYRKRASTEGERGGGTAPSSGAGEGSGDSSGSSRADSPASSSGASD